ncbi:MAG TPA: nuclear transport factor 2 family protein [Pyrinomonadaceae bacterium]|jgi:ketosteroid isomerase-like protein
MKRIAFTIVAILLAFSIGFGQKAAAAKPDPTKPVHDAFDRLVEGIRQSDVDKVMSVYDNSDHILFFNNNGTVTQGWKTMKDLRTESYPKTKNVTLEVTGLRIEMLGAGAAYATCKWKQSQETDGKLESSSGRMTLVFQKIGKQWKVVHLHTSPDAPAANRPVMPSERQPEKP